MHSLHKRCIYSIYLFSISFHHLLFYDSGTTAEGHLLLALLSKQTALLPDLIQVFFLCSKQKPQRRNKKKSLEPSHYYEAI